MTPEQQNKLEAIKAALKQHIEEAEKATPGPWHTKPTSHDHKLLVRGAVGSSAEYSASLQMDGNDAAFIARARTMSPLACKIALTAIEYAEFQIVHGQGGAGFLEDVISIWEGGRS